MDFRSLLRELLGNGPGRAGVAMLAVLAALSIYVLATYPLDFGPSRWSNPAVWADNPKAAPPAWTNLFTRDHRAEHLRLEARSPGNVTQATGFSVLAYELPLTYTADQPPSFTSFSLSGVTFYGQPPSISLYLDRPDGLRVPLLRQVIRGPLSGEEPPFRRYQEEPLRVLLSSEPSVVQATVAALSRQYGTDVSPEELRGTPERALFGVPAEARPQLRPLHGTYRFQVEVVTYDARDTVQRVQVVVGGSVFGLMGTDALGRDLWAGLLFGLPVALFIGLLASVLVTATGTALGVMSGYLGGRTDLLIQRLADLVNNVPLLPLLIFLVFILGPNLFLIILILVAFSWPGLTILVRSMVLQLRTGQEVEAALALGASRWRIMARHVFPHTAPFVFGQLIFFAPGAILAEAALSFLGLGDPSLPTWGQILEQGFRTGAVYVGYWWWVVSPGVLIVITAVTFMLLALGMEPVINPRLRRVR